MRDDLRNICILLAMVLAAITFSVVCGGCQEERKVWGQGEPPGDYTKWFGNDNMARLNFVQTERLNILSQQIAALAEQNAAQHKILGESDIDLYGRVRKLEIMDPNTSDNALWRYMHGLAGDPNAP
jgi:hypothetical protein